MSPVDTSVVRFHNDGLLSFQAERHGGVLHRAQRPGCFAWGGRNVPRRNLPLQVHRSLEVQCGLQAGEQRSENLTLKCLIRDVCPRTAQTMFTFYFDWTVTWGGGGELEWEMWFVLPAASNHRRVSQVEFSKYIFLLEITICSLIFQLHWALSAQFNLFFNFFGQLHWALSFVGNNIFFFYIVLQCEDLCLNNVLIMLNCWQFCLGSGKTSRADVSQS